MQFEFLAHRPDAIPTIGRWYNQEWGQRFHNETEEESIQRLDLYLNEDKIPFILVATEQAGIVGVAQLKFREMPEQFPDKEHWLGGVFVSPQYRGRGLGSLLVEEIARRAPEYGVHTLHLQTEQLDGGLYRRLGWEPVTQVQNQGFEVLIMERRVGV